MNSFPFKLTKFLFIANISNSNEKIDFLSFEKASRKELVRFSFHGVASERFERHQSNMRNPMLKLLFSFFENSGMRSPTLHWQLVFLNAKSISEIRNQTCFLDQWCHDAIINIDLGIILQYWRRSFTLYGKDWVLIFYWQINIFASSLLLLQNISNFFLQQLKTGLNVIQSF